MKWLFHGLSILSCIICFIVFFLEWKYIVIGIINFISIEIIDRKFEYEKVKREGLD